MLHRYNLWLADKYDECVRFRRANKHVWETVISTLDSAKATTIIGSIPYGAGQRLLTRIKQQQHRQTTMALFVLYDSIMNLRLKAGESIEAMFTRAEAIRMRLRNWQPEPVSVPDQLIICSVLRHLPAKYAAVRSIIMSATPAKSLPCIRGLLMDVEGRDADITAAAVGDRATRHETALAATTTAPAPTVRTAPTGIARAGDANRSTWKLVPQSRRARRAALQNKCNGR